MRRRRFVTETIGGIDHFDSVVPRGVEHGLACRCAHCSQAFRLGNRLKKHLNERSVILGHESGNSRGHEMLGSTIRSDDSRNPRGGCFLNDVSVCVSVGGKNEKIYVGVSLRQQSSAQDSCEGSVLQIALQPGALASNPYNYNREIAVAGGEKCSLDIG